MSTYYTKWTEEALLREAKHQGIIGAEKLDREDLEHLLGKMDALEKKVKVIRWLSVASALASVVALAVLLVVPSGRGSVELGLVAVVVGGALSAVAAGEAEEVEVLLTGHTPSKDPGGPWVRERIEKKER